MTKLQDWWWVTEDSNRFTRPGSGYRIEGETIQSRVWDMIENAENHLKNEAISKGKDPLFFSGYKEKMYAYAARGFYSFATPEWSNFGRDTGLPISCNGVYIEDSVDSILDKVKEVGIQTKHGAGTSAAFDALRPRGTKISDGGVADGPAHFAALFEACVDTIRQSSRRGAMCVSLPVDHPDIMEWLQFRDEGAIVKQLSFAVSIPDWWMDEMIQEDSNNPNKKLIWARIIQKRYKDGYPYIFYSDNVNNYAPATYRGKYKIHASNLCHEICLPSSTDWSFSCCLASMNALLYDEWKDTDAVECLVYFLEAVLLEYIEKARKIKGMEPSVKFAEENRAIGIGTLGLHSLFQSKRLPFISEEANRLDLELHSRLADKAEIASRKLAVVLGECKVTEGTGRRHATLTAIAPTTSSAFILGGVSQSIEPENANYYIKDLAKGKFTVQNKYLKEDLEQLGLDTPEVWDSIKKRGGSVQHLDIPAHTKEVYKTFGEINQVELIVRAAARQKFIEQSQSFNIMVHPATNPKDVSEMMILGWELGIKTFYYQRSTNPAQQLIRELATCTACEA